MAAEQRPRRSRRETWGVVAIGVYFVARQLFFALAIAPEIPPDEPTHVGIIELYARSWLGVEDSPASYSLGLVTHVPYLYHLLMGKLLALDLFGLDALSYLRVCNVALSACAFFLAYRLALLLAAAPLERLLFLVMLSNTLMYTFIGAAVSYDNLVHLLGVGGLLALFSHLTRPAPLALLALLACVLAGALTKITFLPLALILALLLAVDRRSALKTDAREVLATLRARRPAAIALCLLSLTLFVANAWLYGDNLLRYGRVVPSCEQVLERESCLENRIYARNWIVNGYRTDELTFDEAISATSMIGHRGDRDHAVRLLRFERSHKQSPTPALSVWDYMRLVWTQAMRPTIFGIQAHGSMLKSSRELLPYDVILFAALLLWIRGARWDGTRRLWIYLGLAAVLYYWFLVGYYNYSRYLSSHAPLLGVQGRYLFPVLVPAYLVAAEFLLAPFRRWLRVAVFLAVSAVFLVGDFPYFLSRASEAWYAPPAAAQDGPAAPERQDG